MPVRSGVPQGSVIAFKREFYLSDRLQILLLGAIKSESLKVRSGVAQDSVIVFVIKFYILDC